MHTVSNNPKTRLIVSNVKLGSLLVIGIIYLKSFLNMDALYTDIDMLVKFILSLLVLAIIAIFYYIYTNILFKKINDSINNIILLLESFLFLVLFMVVILTTGQNQSPYKILFLFIIITTSIEYGFSLGVTFSLISSVFIIAVDLIYGSNEVINSPLENDIIISSIFVITAWFLSFYAKLEAENAKALERRANIDSLTGVYNHRYFHDSIKQIFDSRGDNYNSISLICLDIDHFKDYNDMFGHFKGDQVLKAVSQAIKKQTNDENAIVSRYGGDEFSVILKNKDEQQVLTIAERIRKTLEEMYIEGQEHLPSENLTASIGIAFSSENMSTHLDLLKRADDALYRAKFINKNKVEVYSSVFDMIKNDIHEEQFDLLTSIKTLISVINAKDKYTYGHVERVVTYVKMFAEEIMLSQKDKKTLIYSAYMHDIGKINIPEIVLNKKMPLNSEEWEMIKQHPQNGVEIVNKVESLSDTAPIIKHHHERYDGNGYPDGLKEDEIPYLSRILTIADSFDAMTFSRPYRAAMTFSQAIGELQDNAGKQFDPHLTRIFIKIIKKIKNSDNSYVPYNKDNYFIEHTLSENEKG